MPLYTKQEELRQLKMVDEQASSILAQAGIATDSDGDLGKAVSQYRVNKSLRDQFDNLAERQSSKKQSIASLLSGTSLEELRDELQALAKRIEALEERLCSVGKVEIADATQSYATLVLQKHEQETLVTQLQERIQVATQALPSIAEVEEDIARHESRIADLESYRRSLNTAIAVLREAADEHSREFAPRLEAMLNENLSFLTRDRYSKTHVGIDDLSLAVAIPETQSVQSPDVLSYGTQDELYVLLRMSVAQLLSSHRETIPVVLDDPFVNADSRRLRRMLELLVRLSERHQVFLFTKDTEIRDWFLKTRPPEGSLVQLP